MNPFQRPPAMLELGVNIDHVATIRNVRGTTYPDPLQAARQAEEAGADCITLHLREDRRHIRDADVLALRSQLLTRMNLEIAVTAEMIEFACRLKPHDVCLVPERRAELTTEGGLDVIAQTAAICRAVQNLQQENIRVSLFIDPELTHIDAARATGATVIEFHTGRYATAESGLLQQEELERLERAAQYASKQGLKVNAGHGLHYQNVQAIAAIPEIAELNIGHAIVAYALFHGWQNAVRKMKALMLESRLQAAPDGRLDVQSNFKSNLKSHLK